MSPDTSEISKDQQTPKSIWSRSFIILFFANLALNMGLNMSNSLISMYADHLGATPAVIGMVVSSFGISAILFRMIAAPIMDTYNRKNLVILAALMMSAAFFGFSISTNIPMLVCFRLLQGCSMVFGNACCLTIVADMLPKEKYNSGIGFFSLAQVVCTAIGPSLGLELFNRTDFHITYTVAACFMLVSAFLISFVRFRFVRTKKLKLSVNTIIAKEALLPAVLNFIMILIAAATQAFLFLFAIGQGVSGNIGLYFTVSAVTMLVSRPLIGKLTDKFGLLRISVPALFFSVINLVIISFSTTLPGFLTAAFVSAFGQGAFSPAIQALTMKSVPSERRGAASSTNFIAQDIAGMVGPVLAGQLIEAFGYVSMWRIVTIPLIIGVAIMVGCKGRIERIEEEFASGA